MTPPPVPDDALDADDEAVLAVLDDTATADQRRRVARDPSLRSRLAAQRAAAAALTAPVGELDDAMAHQLRAAALAALDGPTEEAGDGEVTAADHGDGDSRPVVTPLPPRRPARRLPPWPAAAAVVLLLVGVGLALILNDRADVESAATGRSVSDEAAEEAARDLGAEATEGDAESAAADDQADSATAETGAPTSATHSGELPRYPDEIALREALETIDPRTLRSDTTAVLDQDAELTTDQAAFCEPGLRAVLPELGPTQASLLVLVDDVEVLVVSNPVEATAETATSTRLTALDARSCTPLLAVER